MKPSPSMMKDDSVTVIGKSNLQCVIYAKEATGITRSIGYAGTAKADGTVPMVGSIGLLKDWGHAVVIEAINGDRVTITEANWVKGAIDRRVISTSDLRGYIY